MKNQIKNNKKETMVKIAIIGSRSYTNKRKIKQFVWELKQKFSDRLVIVSGGAKDGADKYAKRFALDFDVNYSEFPAYHEPHNIHCVKESFRYNKQYNVGHYHRRNKDLVEYSDKVVAFCLNGEISNGTASALKYAHKIEKKYIIID
jgi:predicted Rossmann-fold nucleotide-binding protein